VKPPRNSAGFCGGGQGLDWAVEPRKEEEDKTMQYNTVISLLPTIYNILSNTLVLHLNPYVEIYTVNYPVWIRRNRLTTDYMVCIHQILEKC
jgi:hypothetical protein